jgi:hypothetical protein
VTSPQSCPSDCSSCGDITMTISGTTDDGCDPFSVFSCADLNGVHTLTRSGCYWSGTLIPSPNGVFAGLSCSVDYWYLQIDYEGCSAAGICCMMFIAPNISGCPPTSGWTPINEYQACKDAVITMSFS